MNSKQITILIASGLSLLLASGLYSKQVIAQNNIPFMPVEQSPQDDTQYDGILLTVRDGIDSSKISPQGFAPAQKVNGTKHLLVDIDQKISDQELEQVLEEFNKDPNVIAAQPNFKYQLDTVPNDTYFSEQWGLENTGQTIGGTAGLFDMDLDGPITWSLEDVTNPTVTVAVIDTGVDPSHPDLSGNLVAGYDFTNSDVNPYDYHGHGTHVAGIIAATSNNSLGVSGVSIKNRIKVMPLKTINFTSAELIAAINYAEANAADVINASWGGGDYDGAMYTAISNFSGLFVAAAGNNALNNDVYPHYPASYDLDNIVAVGSYANSGLLSGFSNYGETSVDVYAPGTHIINTYPLFTPLVEENFTSISLGTDLSGTPFTESVGDWGVINPSCTGCDNGVTIGTNRSYVNNDNQILTLTTPVDASIDTEPPALKFFLNAGIESSGSCANDYLAVETDNNDDSWVTVTKICGIWDKDVEIQLPTAHASLRFRFRWVTNSSVTGTAPFIDDIELLSYGDVSHGYAYLSGTSMASPYIAGEIAMVISETPGLSNTDLKNLAVVSKHNDMANMMDAVINSSTIFDNWSSTAGVASTNLVGSVFNSEWYQTVIGTNNRSYTRHRAALGAWTPWQVRSGYVDTTPAIEEFGGCVYQSIRGRDNQIYNSRSCDGTTWTPLTASGGSTASAPTLAAYNGRLYQSVRGGNDGVYYRYTTDGVSWSGWIWNKGRTRFPIAMVEYNGELWQAIVGLTNTNIYVRRMDSGFNQGPWVDTGGSADSHIAMAVFNGRVYQSYADTSTSINIRSYSTVTDWTDGVFLTGSTREVPSLFVFDSTLFQNALGGGGTLYERELR